MLISFTPPSSCERVSLNPITLVPKPGRKKEHAVGELSLREVHCAIDLEEQSLLEASAGGPCREEGTHHRSPQTGGSVAVYEGIEESPRSPDVETCCHLPGWRRARDGQAYQPQRNLQKSQPSAKSWSLLPATTMGRSSVWMEGLTARHPWDAGAVTWII